MNCSVFEVEEEKLSIMANTILWVTNPISESHKGIWLVAFEMGISEPYGKSSVDGQISAYCQCTKMGQHVTLKSQSLLHILYLGRILDTLGHSIGIIKINGCKRYKRAVHPRADRAVHFSVTKKLYVNFNAVLGIFDTKLWLTGTKLNTKFSKSI